MFRIYIYICVVVEVYLHLEECCEKDCCKVLYREFLLYRLFGIFLMCSDVLIMAGMGSTSLFGGRGYF